MEDTQGNLLVRVPALEAIISNGQLLTSGGGSGGSGSDSALDAIISNGALTTADKNLAALILSGALKVSDTALEALISSGALKVADANLAAIISGGALAVSDTTLAAILVASKIPALVYKQCNGDSLRVDRLGDVNQCSNISTVSASTMLIGANGSWAPCIRSIQISTNSSMPQNGYVTVCDQNGGLIFAWLCAAGNQQLVTPPGFYWRGVNGGSIYQQGTSGIQLFVNIGYCWASVS